MAHVSSPSYQEQVRPDGSWRVRVFHLPELPTPSLPFVAEVWASDLAKAAYWRNGINGAPTVLRLSGPDAAGLDALRLHLQGHGILPVARPGAARKREG